MTKYMQFDKFVIRLENFYILIDIFMLKVFIRLESAPDAMFRSDAGKFALIGLMRDLRGIAMATNRLALV